MSLIRQSVMTHSLNCVLFILIRISSVLNISVNAIVNTLDNLHHGLELYFGFNNVRSNSRIMSSMTHVQLPAVKQRL